MRRVKEAWEDLWVHRSFLVMTVGTFFLTLIIWVAGGIWYQSWVIGAAKEIEIGKSQILLNSLSNNLKRRFSFLEGQALRLLEHKSDKAMREEVGKIAKVLRTVLPDIECFSFKRLGGKYFYTQLVDKSEMECQPFLNPNTPNYLNYLQLAMRTHIPILTGPYKSKGDGRSLVVILAISKENFFWGLATLTFDVAKFLKEAGWAESNSSQMKTALKNNLGWMIQGGEEVFLSEPVLRRIKIAGGDWEFAVGPGEGWEAAHRTHFAVFWSLTFIGGLFVFFTVFLMVDRRYRTIVIKEGEDTPQRRKKDASAAGDPAPKPRKKDARGQPAFSGPQKRKVPRERAPA
ncbi:MAG: hypothetical protein V3V62_05325 [bacterium]